MLKRNIIHMLLEPLSAPNLYIKMQIYILKCICIYILILNKDICLPTILFYYINLLYIIPTITAFVK